MYTSADAPAAANTPITASVADRSGIMRRATRAPPTPRIWCSVRSFAADSLPQRDRRTGRIAKERGLFSFLGITREQVVRLREEFHVYMIESSRINIAGVPAHRIPYLAGGIADAL